MSLYFEHLCQDGGGLPEFQDMDALLHEFFWGKLSREEQDMLLRVAVFDYIREEQLPEIAPGQEAALSGLLVRIPLMHHDQRERISYPHELLRHFLLRMLDTAPGDFRSQVYESAGETYRRADNNKKAVECFFRAGNDEKLFSCELTGLLNEKFGDTSYTALAQTVLKRCPAGLLAAWPLSMLRLCVALFAGTDFDGFAAELERAHDIITENGDPQLMGEWHIVAAFREFPNIAGMKAHYLAAESLMTEPSRIFTPREPYTFGTPSMWYLFYRKPGWMMETAEELRDMLEVYNRLISLSTRNFMCVGLALCYLAIGLPNRAAEWLDQSMTLAEQDKNYTFLACFRKYLSILFLLPSMKKKHGRAIQEIKALEIHYTKAEESRIFFMLEKYPEQMGQLTEREREVAQLVAAGLRNKEIAEKLFISEETVKSHIRSIFNKTNIDRRSRLVELLK